jgi:aminoglycoside phosphotransferase (APT) family kinase protein
VPLDGGFRHRVHRVATGSGDYAVKEYDTTLVGVDPVAVARGADVEEAAGRAGIPVAEAVLPLVREEDGRLFRVHRLVEGVRRDTGPAGAELAGRMGRLLAAIHAAELPPVAAPPVGGPVHVFRWGRHAERAVAAGKAWAGELTASLGAIAEAAEAAAAPPDLPPVTTHRELYAHNVLLTDEGPVVVDWDDAGPWSEAEEVATAAVEWAGGIVGPADGVSLAAFVEGYVGAGGRAAEPSADLFARWLGKQLAWLDEHLERALVPPTPEIGAVADRRLPFLLPRLRRHVAERKAWVDGLRAALR